MLQKAYGELILSKHVYTSGTVHLKAVEMSFKSPFKFKRDSRVTYEQLNSI